MSLLARKGREPARGSMRYRISLLLGRRRRSVVVLAVCSIFSGFTEAGMLALIAQIAATLVSGHKKVHFDHGPIHVDASMKSLILVALGLVILRILLQFPISVLPARIASDVQATMRTRLFDAFTRASWAVQSRDREGQLQETTTSQVMSATGGALQATSLITSSFTFLVLLGSAIALNPLAAVAVAAATVGLFGAAAAAALARGQVLARALESAGRVRGRDRRGDPRRRRDPRVRRRRRPARAHRPARRELARVLLPHAAAQPTRDELLPEPDLPAGRRRASPAWSQPGARTRARCAAVVLVLLRAGTAGQLVQGAYQGLAQSLPFIERTQEAIERYEESAPVVRLRAARAGRRGVLRAGHVRLRRRAPGALGASASRSPAARRSGSSARRARASRRSCSCCCSCARPTPGSYAGQRRSPAEQYAARGLVPAGLLRAAGTAPAARDGRREHPLLPRPRRRGRRTRRRGSRGSTTT